jgi:hypothetical protein
MKRLFILLFFSQQLMAIQNTLHISPECREKNQFIYCKTTNTEDIFLSCSLFIRMPHKKNILTIQNDGIYLEPNETKYIRLPSNVLSKRLNYLSADVFCKTY